MYTIQPSEQLKHIDIGFRSKPEIATSTRNQKCTLYIAEHKQTTLYIAEHRKFLVLVPFDVSNCLNFLWLSAMGTGWSLINSYSHCSHSCVAVTFTKVIRERLINFLLKTQWHALDWRFNIFWIDTWSHATKKQEACVISVWTTLLDKWRQSRRCQP